VRVATILQGSVKRDDTYGIFADGKRRDMFCKRPDGCTILAPLGAGWTAYPGFIDPRVRAWWKPHYQRLLEVGLDVFWHDMNEPSAFAAWGGFTLPRSAWRALDGRGGDHREGHNLFGLLMNRAGYEGLRELRPKRRPWLLSRSGWVGLQRYAWNWTGDIESSWEMLP
jgi:alpha-glucosidase